MTKTSQKNLTSIPVSAYINSSQIQFVCVDLKGGNGMQTQHWEAMRQEQENGWQERKSNCSLTVQGRL